MVRYYIKIVNLKPTYTGGEPIVEYVSADGEEKLVPILRKDFIPAHKDDYHVLVVGAELRSEK